jgi:hypothetical protein
VRRAFPVHGGIVTTMRALIVREAGQMAESAGLGVAMWAHAAWLSAFLAVWGRTTGTPLVPGLTIYEQLLMVQWVLIVVLLPWAAARIAPRERGNRLVLTAGLLAVRPSQVLGARTLALSATLVLVAASGLPLVVIAVRMSDVAPSRAIVDQTAVIACGLAVAPIVSVLQQALAGRVVVWLTATALTIAIAFVAKTMELSPSATALLFTIVGVGVTMLHVRSDVSLRYLSENSAWVATEKAA